jgi:hypothetical protein
MAAFEYTGFFETAKEMEFYMFEKSRVLKGSSGNAYNCLLC